MEQWRVDGLAAPERDRNSQLSIGASGLLSCTTAPTFCMDVSVCFSEAIILHDSPPPPHKYDKFCLNITCSADMWQLCNIVDKWDNIYEWLTFLMTRLGIRSPPDHPVARNLILCLPYAGFFLCGCFQSIDETIVVTLWMFLKPFLNITILYNLAKEWFRWLFIYWIWNIRPSSCKSLNCNRDLSKGKADLPF